MKGSPNKIVFHDYIKLNSTGTIAPVEFNFNLMMSLIRVKLLYCERHV